MAERNKTLPNGASLRAQWVLTVGKVTDKTRFCLRSDTIMCRIMLVTPGKGDLIPYNVVFDSLTLETVDTSTD